MRLLHIHTWRFQEFYSDPPPYAITSHRWASQELTFQELNGPSLPPNIVDKAGYQKVSGFCKAIQRLMDLCPKLKVEYIWIDTCCIDRTNSVELQESLNSMFKWYAKAELCLAYLHDVKSLDEHAEAVVDSFRSSVWFKRGWTLQELLAPKRLFFYNQDWDILGRKKTKWRTPWQTARASGLMPLNSLLERWTRIPDRVLRDYEGTNEDLSIEEKRSWMQNRSTSRVEDKVYCQLGIFGVFMPLIYGEGEHAIFRLEEAIAQKQRRKRIQPVPVALPSPARTATRTFIIHYLAVEQSPVKRTLEASISVDKYVYDLKIDVLRRLRTEDYAYHGPTVTGEFQTAWWRQSTILDGKIAAIAQDELYLVVRAFIAVDEPIEASKLRTFRVEYGRNGFLRSLNLRRPVMISIDRTAEFLEAFVGEWTGSDGKRLKNHRWVLTAALGGHAVEKGSKIGTLAEDTLLEALWEQ